MLQIIVVVLMILTINGQIQIEEIPPEYPTRIPIDIKSEMDSLEYSLVSFTNTKTLLAWHWDLYRIVKGLFEEAETAIDAKLLLEELDSSIMGLNDLDVGNLDLHLMDHLFSSKNLEISVNIDSTDEKSRPISDYMIGVNGYYRNLNEVKCSDRGQADVQSYFDSVLTNKDSVPSMLEQLHDIVIKKSNEEITSTPIEQSQETSDSDCNHRFSRQQEWYYVYVHLLLTEMKGFATLLHVYTRKWLLDQSSKSYIKELNSTRENFEKWLKKYHEIFSTDINSLSRLINSCQPSIDEHENSFLELEYFSRISIEPHWNGEKTCKECSAYSTLGYNPKRGTTIYNCHRIGNNLGICPAERGSQRAFMWIYDIEMKTFYGHHLICANRYHFIDGIWNSTKNCGLCACSEDLDKKIKGGISTISLTEQMSDICNNMVVTDVKFVVYENAIHLQIQQTKFSKDVLTHGESSWKELDVSYNCSRKEATKLKYKPLEHRQKTIYLDDIEVPNGYVVTGVRFKFVNNSAFMLQVHATSFHIGTAKLDSSKSGWFSATTNPMIPESYNRSRVRIDIYSANDPMKGDSFRNDPESNKLITFTHTDLIKDAGQTTIPFFDARAAQMTQLIPLSGVGIYFRGQEGYAGYITPRIYTMNIGQYLQTKLSNETCHLK